LRRSIAPLASGGEVVDEVGEVCGGNGPERERTLALALGGGGARGLAHIGVLQVLEQSGLQPQYLSGTSIGGLIGALWASGASADAILRIARGFHFPRRFSPGQFLNWDQIFAPALPVLADRSFESLATPLVVSAVDLVAGEEIPLHSGPVLPAVRATCAVPAFFVPEAFGARYLVDGGVTNVLPVDLAWCWEPDVVVAVNIVATPRRFSVLGNRYARIAAALGRLVPNPLSAHVAYEVAMRAVEIALDRQRAMAVAMTGPEVLIDVNLGDVAIDEFERLDEIVEIGQCAARAALPRIEAAMASPPCGRPRSSRAFLLHVDPVCHMSISPARARASVDFDGVTYYFCSRDCRDSFERYRDRYVRLACDPASHLRDQ
jgi:NTE family protein